MRHGTFHFCRENGKIRGTSAPKHTKAETNNPHGLTNFYTTEMEGDGPQILGTGAKFKRVPYQKSCRVNRAIVKLLELCNREKMQHFTLMGDISKTYHRVLILEEDQHVHRVLWRNLETDAEPDPYVKTVLMFGEKPAPAMAQIAVRKTAEEKVILVL